MKPRVGGIPMQCSKFTKTFQRQQTEQSGSYIRKRQWRKHSSTVMALSLCLCSVWIIYFPHFVLDIQTKENQMHTFKTVHVSACKSKDPALYFAPQVMSRTRSGKFDYARTICQSFRDKYRQPM